MSVPLATTDRPAAAVTPVTTDLPAPAITPTPTDLPATCAAPATAEDGSRHDAPQRFGGRRWTAYRRPRRASATRGGSLLGRVAGPIVLLLVIAGALILAAFAQPAVGTHDVQRRDRQAPAGRFVDDAYLGLLNRRADRAGRSVYEKLYEQRGAEAVAEAIIRSPEYEEKHPERAASRAAGAEKSSGAEDVDAESAALAREFVARYEAGAPSRQRTPDAVGRVGFVLTILGALAVLRALDRRSHQAGEPAPDRLYLPARYIVGLFAALGGMWWLSDQLSLDSFARGRFGYLEWLTRVLDLGFAVGPFNVWTPYPQGAQGALILVRLASDALAAPFASDVWTPYTMFRLLFPLVFLLAPSLATVLVVYRLGARFGLTTATIASATAAFSFAPIYYAVASIDVMDPLPVLVTVLGAWALERRRFGLAGAAIGVGATLKLFPILLLPVAMIAAPDRAARLRVLVATGLVVAAIFGPPALANREMFLSPLHWQSSRPPWESWYAFANWVTDAPHEYTRPYFRDTGVGDAYGWVFWGLTPPPAALLSPVPAGPLRWENVVSLIGTLGTLGVCLAAKSTTPRALIRWTLYCFAGYLFWSIGWSPQYELFLIPFILLAFEAPRLGVMAALLLQLLTFLEYPLLLPWAYFYGGSAVWLAWAALLARYLLLAWLCLFVVRAEASWSALRGRLSILCRRPTYGSPTATAHTTVGTRPD